MTSVCPDHAKPFFGFVKVSASSAKCDLTKMTVKFVSPTKLLSEMGQRSIPASSLKLNKHFAVIEEWEKNDTKEVLENVTAELQRLIFGQPLYFMAVAKCKLTIYDLLWRLLKKSESQDSGSEWSEWFIHAIYSWCMSS